MSFVLNSVTNQALTKQGFSLMKHTTGSFAGKTVYRRVLPEAKHTNWLTNYKMDVSLGFKPTSGQRTEFLVFDNLKRCIGHFIRDCQACEYRFTNRISATQFKKAKKLLLDSKDTVNENINDFKSIHSTYSSKKPCSGQPCNKVAETTDSNTCSFILDSQGKIISARSWQGQAPERFSYYDNINVKYDTGNYFTSITGRRDFSKPTATYPWNFAEAKKDSFMRNIVENAK